MKKQGKTIFRSIFTAMLIVLGIEIILLVISLALSHVGTQLNSNAVDILKKQVENRQNYLQSVMDDNEDLHGISVTINNVVQETLDSRNQKIDELNTDDNLCALLMEDVSDDLISCMRHKAVTGIFMIFNTEDLDQKEADSSMSGIYIRDMDPSTAPSDNNYDLLLERSPARLIKSIGVSTDKSWMPSVKYEENNKNYIYPSFQEAYEDHAQLDAENYGHWTFHPYTLTDDDRPAIAYTVPLILDDGTVYGVIGVEMLTSYLETLMPYTELQNDDQGTYFLVETDSDLEEKTAKIITVDSSSKDKKLADYAEKELSLKRFSKNVYDLAIEEEDYVAAAIPLNLYNKNAPFSDEQWLLMGVVETENLFAFSRHVLFLLALAIAGTFVVGVISSLAISKRLADPVHQLSEEVAVAQANAIGTTIPDLSKTGIRELDQFAEAITQLSKDVLNSSTKFLRIMEMASVELGGYEIQKDTGSIYVTENFFGMLGLKQPETELTVEKFRTMQEEFRAANTCTSGAGNSEVFCIRSGKGKTRYVRVETKSERDREIGLLEDVTSVMMERLRIEYERDYDALTGLYNRRAFKRKSEKLFAKSAIIGHGAFLMLDLDNLKHTNDTFGHDWGDEYIRQVGQSLKENVQKGVLSAHISGDEFSVLFYGQESQEKIREIIRNIEKSFSQKIVKLPDGQELPVRVSGGIAWYPENSTDLNMLKKQADFAMYQVKKTQKGVLGEFDEEIYAKEFQDSLIRSEFHRLVEEELVTYYFQPIVSAETGETVAFEALMRIGLSVLKNPEVVMRVAREEGGLHDIERITMFKAAEGFCKLKENRDIRGDELLFVNSIASQHLTEEEVNLFSSRYDWLKKQLVIEITEEEELDPEALQAKRNAPGFVSTFALDDYGSGYSNERSLLDLAPGYIKVDRAIIREIHTDQDKQQILANIVTYAHQRNMKIVAEGLETPEEILKVLELGADLLQGFYLAKPEAVPKAVDPAAVELIRKFHSQQ